MDHVAIRLWHFWIGKRQTAGNPGLNVRIEAVCKSGAFVGLTERGLLMYVTTASL